MCFLPKDLCNVREAEIARAVRLCKTTVEPIFIKVPRTRVSIYHNYCRMIICILKYLQLVCVFDITYVNS